MADQNGVLSFVTKVDLSGVQQGMAAATQTIQSGSQTMASAMNAAKISASQLSDAYKAFGAAAAGGSAQATEALHGYVVANEEAQAAVRALSEAEATEEVVLKSSISARMAASAELRVLSGNIQGSTRAAAAFLTTLPGVGAAMQAAFSVFGVVALIEVLGQAAIAVSHLITAFHDLKGAETDAGTAAILAGEKIIKVHPSKMSTDAAARFLSGIPENSPVEVQQAAAAIKQIGYQRQIADIQAQNNEAGKTGADLQRQKVVDLQQEAQFATQAAVKAQELIDIYKQQLDARVKIFIPGAAGRTESQKWDTSNRQITDPDQIKAIQDQMRSAQQAKEQFEQDQKVSLAKIPGVENREASAGLKDASKAASEHLKSLQNNLVQEELINGKSAAAEEAHWSKYVNTFDVGSSQYDAVSQKLLEAKTKVSEEFGRDAMKLVEDGQREIDENNKVSEALNKTYEEITKKSEEAAKGQEQFDADVRKLQETMTQSAANIQLASIAQEQSEGTITKLGAAHQIAAIHAQEYADKLKALNAELDAINAQNPTDQKGVDDQQRQSLAVQQQMEQVKGQQGTSAISNQTTINNQIAQPYVNAFNTINSSWLNVQNQLIHGTRNVGAAFANMGVSILESVAGNFEKMIAKAAESEIRMLIIHMTTNQAKVATDATAAAQSDSISALSSLKQVSHEAAVAAAGAWAALSGIPIIGPVLGGVAAAATYAGVMALAAFDTGGIIANTGIALVHKDEAVLPANLTGLLMNAAGGGTTNSASSSMIQNNHFSGSSDRQFQRQLTRNSKTAMSSVRRQARSMGKV